MTSFFGARMDSMGRLIVTVLTATIPHGANDSAGNLKSGWSIVRFSPEGRAPTTLFTDHQNPDDPASLSFAPYGPSFTTRAWDVDPTGRIIFADPRGQNRVGIGHPADGDTRVVDLPEYAGDPDNLREFSRSIGRSWKDVPRVAAVYSIDGKRFIVKPTACIRSPAEVENLKFELFDYDGNSYGRHALDCDYDPAFDGMFVTKGTLIVVKGGKSAKVANLRQQASMTGSRGESDPEHESSQMPDMITVLAYDLVAYYSR
jgi:hypothetical protein